MEFEISLDETEEELPVVQPPLGQNISVGSLCLFFESHNEWYETTNPYDFNQGIPVRVIRVHSSSAEIVYVENGSEQNVYKRSLLFITNEPKEVKQYPLPDLRNELIENTRALYRSTVGYDDELSRILRDLVVYGTGADVPAWFYKTIASSIDDSRQISWATDPRFVDIDTRRKRGRPKVFLNHCARKYGLELGPKDIDRLAYLIGTQITPRGTFTFEIVSGDDLYNTYQNDYPGSDSCMRGKSYVWLYAMNPDKVRMVRILENEDFCGRALLWNTDEGVIVLDRIYPSDGGLHIIALKKWAKEQGWDHIVRESFNEALESGRTLHVTLKNSPDREFPYIDTFRYTDYIHRDILVLNNADGEYEFDDQYGSYSGENDEERDDDDDWEDGEDSDDGDHW